MNRLDVLHQITELEITHCETCTLKAEFRRIDANKLTHMCISQCEIGKQIRELGKQLESDEPKKKDKHTPKRPFKQRKRLNLTKEKLEELLKDHTAADVARMYGVHRETISRYKSKWKIGRKGA